MALSNEDKGDVKKAMGAAMAKRVSKVTRDKPKLYNIKDRQRAKPMSEFMKEGRASTNAITPGSSKSKELDEHKSDRMKFR